MICIILITLAAELCAEDVHIVAKGETVYAIARSYGVTVDELVRHNNISDPNHLVAGRRLRIPGNSAFIEYKAVRGDNLTSIARRFGITLQSLLNANALSMNYMLREGDILRIPQQGAAATEQLTAPAIPPVPSVPLTPAVPLAPLVEPRPTAGQPVSPSVRWPVAAREVIYMTGKLSGVVLVGEKTESVKSLTEGTVVSAGPYRGFGRVVIVQVAGGYLYVYGGCESLSVKEGDKVRSGTELGRLGLDAVSGKPELFFLVYRSNVPVDPAIAPRT